MALEQRVRSKNLKRMSEDEKLKRAAAEEEELSTYRAKLVNYREMEKVVSKVKEILKGAVIKNQLDTKQRMKLIEILLIVGSIIAAFKIPISLIWLFMLFVLCSIFYYITQQKWEDSTHPSIISVVGMSIVIAVISSTFVGIIIHIFINSLSECYPREYLGLIWVIGVIYYFVFAIIICLALRPFEMED